MGVDSNFAGLFVLWRQQLLHFIQQKCVASNSAGLFALLNLFWCSKCAALEMNWFEYVQLSCIPQKHVGVSNIDPNVIALRSFQSGVVHGDGRDPDHHDSARGFPHHHCHHCAHCSPPRTQRQNGKGPSIYIHRRRIGIRPELSRRIDTHFNSLKSR